MAADGKLAPDVPSIVNLLFAIELAFKASLLAKGSTKKTHELWELFELLPQADQLEVAHHAGVEPQSFRDNLRSVEGAFQAWRYAHEKQGVLSISLLFLEMAWLGALALAERYRAEQLAAFREARE